MYTTTSTHPRLRLLSLGLALLATSACFEVGDTPIAGQDGSSGEGDTGSPESSTSAGEPGDGSTTSADPAEDTGESGDPPPSDEICNGLDDDEDGMVDEDQPMLSCGVGACEVGVPSCVAGDLQECTPALPGGEVCNGLDDDCNGTTDDLQQACSTACGDGMVVCMDDEPTCDAPVPAPELCNVVDDDCNGSFDEDLEGCRVVIQRAISPAPQHVYTTSIEEAQCCGNYYEGPTFMLYADMHAGLVPFYRCEGAGGYQLLSLDAACEGLPTNAGALGYIATAEGTAGAVHLFRLSHANGDHLYLTSEVERDQAVAMYGYVDEGTIGYAWPLE